MQIFRAEVVFPRDDGPGSSNPDKQGPFSLFFFFFLSLRKVIFPERRMAQPSIALFLEIAWPRLDIIALCFIGGFRN